MGRIGNTEGLNLGVYLCLKREIIHKQNLFHQSEVDAESVHF